MSIYNTITEFGTRLQYPLEGMTEGFGRQWEESRTQADKVVSLGIACLSSMLTAPLWILGKGLHTICPPYSPPVEEGLNTDEEHITKEDILAIGKQIVGLRHVSTAEHAESDDTYGVVYGCALNLSFPPRGIQDDKETFRGLDESVAVGERLDCIPKYEKAITSFIKLSIERDIGPVATYPEMFEKLDQTTFMITAPTFSPVEMETYADCFGLGRFPNEHIPSEGVRLLPRITRDETKLLLDLPDSIELTDEVRDQVLSCFSELYLQRLLEFIRNDLENFNTRVYYDVSSLFSSPFERE